jgi:hypothetical protein
MMKQHILLKKLGYRNVKGKKSMKILWTAFKAFGDHLFDCSSEGTSLMETDENPIVDNNYSVEEFSDDSEVESERPSEVTEEETAEETEEETAEETEEETEEETAEETEEETEEKTETSSEETESSGKKPIVDSQEMMFMKMFESEEVINDEIC